MGKLMRWIIILLLAGSVYAYTPYVDSTRIIDQYNFGTGVYIKARVYGTDTARAYVNLQDAFGGLAQFSGLIFYNRYRSDSNNTTLGSSLDSVRVKISYLYGGVARYTDASGRDRINWCFSDDTISIDTGASTSKNIPDYLKNTQLVKYADLYTKAHAAGEFRRDTVQLQYGVKSNDTTYIIDYNTPEHNAAMLQFIGLTGNAKKRLDYALPIDSSHGTDIEVWFMKTPGPMRHPVQPIPIWIKSK